MLSADQVVVNDNKIPYCALWITHPIYQENYYNLLSANEIGNLITYIPSRISSYLDSFDGYYKAALMINEVCKISMFRCTFGTVYYYFM